MTMHWLVVLAALVAWHAIMLVVLWFLPLPPRLERYKPWVMGAGVVVAILLVLHHSNLL
jgi:hypothetical protein